jgi:hypothetical protein
MNKYIGEEQESVCDREVSPVGRQAFLFDGMHIAKIKANTTSQKKRRYHDIIHF